MRKILLIAILFAFSHVCFAQTPGTGFPIYGSFEPSPADTVNRYNLDSVLTMPIVSGKGRGLNFSYSVSYNSFVWTISSPPLLGLTWQPNFYGTFGSGPLPWGWNTTLVNGGATYNDTATDCGGPRINTYTGFLWVAPDGTQRIFPITTVNYGTCTGTSVSSGNAAASDSSGYHMWVTNYNTMTVFAPDGTQVYPSQKDTNGNFVSSTVVGSETDWTDSAGHLIMKVVSGTSTILYEVAAPDGTYQTTTLNLTTYNVKSNFGCSGIGETTTTAKLPSSLVYPNGQQYTFTYEPTPGNSGYVTGRIKKATLPNGGFVQYTYGATNDGISCADGTIVNVTRLVNDAGIWNDNSTWTFVRVPSGSNWNTTVTYPQMPYDTAANQSVYTFNSSGEETQAKIYQGSSTSGTLLRTLNTTWAANKSPATKIIILEDNSTQSEIETNYDSNGNLLSLKEHDYGTGAPGAILRTTTNTFLSTSAYTNLNIVDRMTRQTIANSGGTLHFRQDTTYDSTTISPCPTGAAQHDDTNYGCSFTARGNPTSVTKYTNASVPSGPITLNSYYDMFGNLVKADLGCCNSKAWAFSAATQYAYPDSDTCGAAGGPQVTSSYTYNTHTGQMASMTDSNAQVWSYAYDTIRRPTTTTRPDMAQISTSYQDSQNAFTRSIPTQSANSRSAVVTVDGVSRRIVSIIQDNSSNIYSKLQRQPDPLARQYKISNPYTGVSPQYWTTDQYEALGREVKRILQDGSQSTWTYVTNAQTYTDPAGHQRKSQANGLSQLASVFEPDPANNNSLTLQTTYGYTVLGRLASIAQGSQTRTYGYDDAGRMTSMATPEAGTANYQYNNFDKRTQRTDARGVITTYTYDTMNRPYQTIYNVGTTGVPATPTVTNTYGTSAVQLNNGLLLSVTDGIGSRTYAYDNLGRTTQEQQVIAGITYTVGYLYNADGTVSSLSYPSGRVVLQNYDAIGRVSSISSGTTTYASNFTYGPLTRATGWNYGNGAVATIGYSPDRLDLQSFAFSKSGTNLFNTSYGFLQNGGNNSQITTLTDSVDAGRSATLTYDALNRLSAVVTAGSANYPKWGLSFTYDRYGNRVTQSVTSGTAPSSSVTVSATTNHITTSGYAYDSSGDLTNDGINALTYDGEGREVTAIDGSGAATYSYSSTGQRAVKNFAGTTTVYIFSNGHVIAEYAGGSLSKEYANWGERRIATHIGTTLYYHGFDNHSIRLTMDASGNKVGEQGHFPFGEDWYMTNTTSSQHFTMYERDSESGNDYAMHRFYVNRIARFSSPDPARGRTQSPQSLNLYSYVSNDPWNAADPSGLSPEGPDPCPDPLADCAICPVQIPGCYNVGGPCARCERIENPPDPGPPPVVQVLICLPGLYFCLDTVKKLTDPHLDYHLLVDCIKDCRKNHAPPFWLGCIEECVYNFAGDIGGGLGSGAEGVGICAAQFGCCLKGLDKNCNPRR